jgi:signal transduction histidine kinase
VAHEINSPLSGIVNYVRLMIKILGRGSLEQEAVENFKRYLELIESETSRTSQIVSNLLAYSRKSKMAFGPVNPRELLQKCIMLSQHKVRLQNIQIKTELQPNLTPVKGDFNQLQQCILNLIFNAIDAMPDGGILTLKVSMNSRDRVVEIRVQDTGKGIPKEALPHVFEPFYTTKVEGEGLGLGLPIVYNIVDRHKGTIHVDSEPGRGTVFTIKLPWDN